ncbi:MAG TPA: lysophospholipid acyltransferase family protein [Ignavibacteriaceae bacterium]|nr:lysophospholipid acyltransferase family protein [Ignavibacteriaceae bacterium]
MFYVKIFFIVLYTIIVSILALISGLLDKSYLTYKYCTKLFSTGILLLSGVKVKVHGLENISGKGPFIFVSNHISQFDIIALQYTIPLKAGFVFKKELAKIPIFGWQLLLGPHIVIDRSNAEKALKSIHNARYKMKMKSVSMILFPEGTRSKNGELQPFKRGAFHLASQVNYPIIPVTIRDSDKLLPKGSLKINKGTINVFFSKPVMTTNIESRNDELELMAKVKDIISDNYYKN